MNEQQTDLPQSLSKELSVEEKWKHIKKAQDNFDNRFPPIAIGYDGSEGDDKKRQAHRDFMSTEVQLAYETAHILGYNSALSEVEKTHTPDKNIDEAIESKIKEAQTLQTKEEWGKHINFLREHVGKVVTQIELEHSENWYKRIFGEESLSTLRQTQE